MEFNRNQYFMFGLIVIFVGIQLRMVDTIVLNEKSSQFIDERMAMVSSPDEPTQTNQMMMVSGSNPSLASPSHTIDPPDWLGWASLSIGAVLILHSLAMKRPN